MKIGIIGGGASGMFLASMLSNHNVTIFEKNSKLGRKLLLTGNGKCNFTNESFDNINEIYNSNFAIQLYNQYNNIKFTDFLSDIGIEFEINRHRGIGFYYPKTNKSSSVYYALLDKIISNKVNIKLNTLIEKIEKHNDKFILHDCKDKYEFDYIVISTGGSSYKNTGSTGDGYKFAKDLGHRIIKPLPALCGYKINNLFLDEKKGVRVFTKVSAIDIKSNIVISSEIGEVQFSGNTISGYPIMNLSRIVNRYIDNGKNIRFNIDLTYGISGFNNVSYLKSRKEKLFYRIKNNFLVGLVDDSLANNIYKCATITGLNSSVSEIKDNELLAIYDKMKNFSVEIINNLGFDNAQITIGGVDTAQIDITTLESKIVKGLYFTGEVMDIDGKCGGYNLQMCFSTASAVKDALDRL